MKARLNLTIDEDTLSVIKSYAEQKKVSISAIVEEHFKSISAPPKHKNIIDMVRELNAPDIDFNADLKKDFYEERASKYGF